LIALFGFAPPVASAPDCADSTVGFAPLVDLGPGAYMGFQGGLYPGGSNETPEPHRSSGLAEAFQVQPLDLSGDPDPGGSIVLLSIGMSNTSQEFAKFREITIGYPSLNPRLKLVNGATGGWPAAAIADSTSQYWSIVDGKLAAAHASPSQVQAIWFLEANANPTDSFPEHADSLQAQFGRTMNIVRSRYPNARLCYLSSRIYAGYASTTLNPEPYAYESGFAVKWLIEDQIGGEPELNFDPNAGPVNAPWLAWGPYLWADGVIPRSDGLVWLCDDFEEDGTHPAEGAEIKVANMLLDFFASHETATLWFLDGVTGVASSTSSSLSLVVHPPRPNPFRERTALAVDVREVRPVQVEIVTVSGRRLGTIVRRELAPGRWTFHWDGMDSGGRPASPGVYFVQVRSGGVLLSSAKVTLVR
jgi:hypothetical protein